jgi:inner membrane protein
MASIITHAIASVSIGKLSLLDKTGVKFWLLAAVCAMIPDADAVGFWYGVPYESVWGHRGITHSIFFAVLLASLVMLVFYRSEESFSKSWWIHWAVFFLATVSHPVLDAMTTGGLGVAFFAPFNNTRYFFPFRPISVSPIGIINFFSEWGKRVIISEFIWVWIPSFILIAASYGLKKLFAR